MLEQKFRAIITIGKNSKIGANAVVKHSVPDGTIVYEARPVVKYLESEQTKILNKKIVIEPNMKF